MKLIPINLLLMASLLTACASSSNSDAQLAGTGDSQGEQVTTFTREERQGNVVIHSNFGSSDIKNWRVIDSTTMVIETYTHGDFMATFAQRCSGIRFAETIGFQTMGPFQLDRSTKIILPDGRRCFFKELKPYTEAEQSEQGQGENGDDIQAEEAGVEGQ